MSQTTKLAGYQSALTMPAPVVLENKDSSPRRFVFEGDSLTADGSNGGMLANAAGNSWPEFAMQLSEFKSLGSYNNFAVGGSTIATMDERYTAQVLPLKPSGIYTKSELFIMIGANDYMFGVQASAAFITALDDYITRAIADGFSVRISTIMFGSYALSYRGVTSETWRYAVNLWIRKQGYRCLSVFDLDAYFEDAYDTFLFNVDAVHPNITGNKLLAFFYNNTLKGGYYIDPTRTFLFKEKNGGNLVAKSDNEAGFAVTSTKNDRKIVYIRTAGPSNLFEIQAYTHTGSVYERLDLNPNGGEVYAGGSKVIKENSSTIGGTDQFIIASAFQSERATGNNKFLKGVVISNDLVTAATTVRSEAFGTNKIVNFPNANGTVVLSTGYAGGLLTLIGNNGVAYTVAANPV